MDVDSETLQGKPPKSGVPLAEVFVVGLLLVLLLMAACFSSFVKSRRTSEQNACIGNMRIIDAGKEQWAMAAKKVDGDPVDVAAANQYIKGNTTPICPGGGRYIYHNIGSAPECTGVTVTDHKFGG